MTNTSYLRFKKDVKYVIHIYIYIYTERYISHTQIIKILKK